jgi:hypothetical protein
VKRLRAGASLVGGLAVAAAVVGTAAGASHAFRASYTGTVTEKVDGQAVTATPRGKGTGTPIGPGTLAGTAGKLKVKLLATSRGCAASEEDRDNISFSGSAKVTGGTGKFRAARGTLRFTGHYNRANGSFNVKLSGTLKY